MNPEDPQFSPQSPKPHSTGGGRVPSDDIALPPAKRSTAGGAPAPIIVPSTAAAASKPPAGPQSAGGARGYFPWVIAGAMLLVGYFWWNAGNAESKREQLYAARESEAAAEIQTLLTALRQQVLDKKLTFTVGYTEPLNRSLQATTGLVPPANLAARARDQEMIAAKLSDIEQRAEQSAKNPGAVQQASETPQNADRVARSEQPAKVPEPQRPKPDEAQSNHFDWRERGLVTPVKDQGMCGSCWAFATVGAFESNYLIRNGGKSNGVDLSEQQVVDCSQFGSCEGGWWAFDYLLKTGIGDEPSYPYQGVDLPPAAKISRQFRAVSWGYVPAEDETAVAADPNRRHDWRFETWVPPVKQIKKALVEHGPLAVGVHTNALFRAYTGGVFNDSDPGAPDHAVTLIGWDDGRKAWLIKNSWGTVWGENGGRGNENGYMWIAYDSCKIGSMAAWVDARSNAFDLPQEYYDSTPGMQPQEP